ncbi:MAG: hypothetical protein K5892_02810 [Acholeplasmatales bacterium]|jgi:ribosome maturation factor RimP|nr:hypothetical protein [Acholeplasmatales bacterium]
MDINICKEILMPYLKDHNLIYYDTELVKEDSNLILRVMIDSDNGIDLDTLADANNYLSERISKYDSDMPEYILEVSSPGAERLLRNDEEITKYIGSYIHVEKGEQIYEGVLLSYDLNEVEVRVNLKGRFKNFKIAKSDITLIRLAVKI